MPRGVARPVQDRIEDKLNLRSHYLEKIKKYQRQIAALEKAERRFHAELHG